MTELGSRKGVFIALEGVEGAGKTTQARMLDEWLDARGIAHTSAREPGGTSVGEAIRHVVQDRPELEVPPETELLLYVASRAAYVSEIVLPALARGEVVVSDRYSWSTLAYQGYGRELDLEAVRAVNRFGTRGLEPDVYLVFDLPVEVGRARQAASGQVDDRMERAGATFLERVRRGYHQLAAAEPRARIVDASGDPRTVHARVMAALREALPETFGATGVSTENDVSAG